MRLFGQIVEVANLSSDERDAMLQLMQRHYCNVLLATFEADLAEKQWVIQIKSQATGELFGFSTQMVLDTMVAQRPIKALFSGDTIVDRDHWGDRALMQTGGRLALSLVETWPHAELYWFLISQGYKTYRFLPVFFREFYPRFDVPMPDDMRQVLNVLAGLKFAGQFDPVTGVVRVQHDQYRLREGVADVTAERATDPHVAYFVERNPGHAVGDELCCIARLSRDNFTKAAYRVLGSRHD